MMNDGIGGYRSVRKLAMSKNRNPIFEEDVISDKCFGLVPRRSSVGVVDGH